MYLRILQVNIGNCRAAQDLERATAIHEEIDVLITSEQYKNEEGNWYSDSGKLAAVSIVSNRATVDEVGPCENNFRWIKIDGKRIYSCYCSPNSGIDLYNDFLTRLELSIKAAKDTPPS